MLIVQLFYLDKRIYPVYSHCSPLQHTRKTERERALLRGGILTLPQGKKRSWGQKRPVQHCKMKRGQEYSCPLFCTCFLLKKPLPGIIRLC